LEENNDLDSVKSLLIQLEPNNVIISSKSDSNLIHLLNRFVIQSDNSFDDNYSNDFNETNVKTNSSETTFGSINQRENVWTKSESRRTSETPQTSNDGNYEITTTIESDSSNDILDTLWHFNSKFQLHLISHNLFNFEHSKSRISSLDLSIVHNLRDETQKFIYISSLIDLSHYNTVRSLGALLKFLDKNRIGIQSENNCSMTEIREISYFYLQELVSIDRNSYESLQIFKPEWHPSAYKQGLQMKEGLSLYGIFNVCVSKLGSYYLRKLFLRPTQDIDVITDRLDIIEFFTQSNNFILRDNLNEHLKHIKNLSPLVKKLKTSTFTVNDLKTLYKTLINALLIRDIIKKQNVSLKVFNKIKKLFTTDLDELVDLLNKVVDFEESFKTQKFQVNSGVDQELDEAKQVFNQLPELLNEIAEQELMSFIDIFHECNCVYIPQIGFLTSAPLIEQQTAETYLEYGLDFVFSAGDRAYYKSDRMKQLDENFGDIQSEIYDRHIQISNRLQDFVINNKYLFDSIMKCCAKLDCLIAMSRTALNFNYSRPNLTSNGVIEIIGGRHPLLELVSQSFVPNDTHSGGRYKKVKILTGPNACGKSVYLKQVSLIVYLAHIGSFVPALRADITIIDRMFTRIHTPESISTRLSTFMLDLNQMANATKNATKRSLVVVDEFGKGTQPVDGIALMAASLRHFLLNNTPHLIISTHFHSLHSFIGRNDLYDCQTFEFMRSETQLIHLYKLKNGFGDQSIASHIAFLAGIPLPIIERGLEICQLMSENQPIDRFYFKELDHKFKKYIEIASKLLELNIDSDREIDRFVRFVLPSN
jgi:DNA mismatch repair protein MSH5